MRGCHNRSALPARTPSTKNNAIPIPPQAYNALPDIPNFDSYDGPTLEELQDDSLDLNNFPLNPYAEPTKRSSWEYFKDYGYRLPRNFSNRFNEQNPLWVSEHLLPIPDFQQDAESSIRIQNDAIEMGMQEMLDIAGPPDESRSLCAFVCGKTDDGQYIVLNPTRDEVVLEEDEIDITLDIDSIIWVTHNPDVEGSIKLFVFPQVQHHAPIHVNNHCYVELLWPQSTRDDFTNRRSEWFTKPVPLSNIPHIPFGEMGNGAGRFNFYIFFPRMMHKQPNTRYSATSIP